MYAKWCCKLNLLGSNVQNCELSRERISCGSNGWRNHCVKTHNETVEYHWLKADFFEPNFQRCWWLRKLSDFVSDQSFVNFSVFKSSSRKVEFTKHRFETTSYSCFIKNTNNIVLPKEIFDFFMKKKVVGYFWGPLSESFSSNENALMEKKDLRPIENYYERGNDLEPRTLVPRICI